MRITREILLGIGIGLIISSLLMLVFFPVSVEKGPKQVVESKPVEKQSPPIIQDKKRDSKTLTDEQPASSKPPVLTEKITVIIPKGTNSERIASILAESHVIKSPKDFSQMAKALKVENKFIAGSYIFNKDEELSNVIKKLIQGPKKE